MNVVLIDTTIFCDLLALPGKAEDHSTRMQEFREKIDSQDVLLLPMATILETGNHIGQIVDGNQRWKTATSFVELVMSALRGESPFIPTPFFDLDSLLSWLGEFPEWSKQRSGLGDLSIQREFDRQCELNPARRVYVWSRDRHLAAYDRLPKIAGT